MTEMLLVHSHPQVAEIRLSYPCPNRRILSTTGAICLYQNGLMSSHVHTVDQAPYC